MLRKSSLILLLALASCKSPKLTVCVVDIAGLQCHDARTNKDFVVPIKEASDKNYVATPPEDFGRLLDFIQNGCK